MKILAAEYNAMGDVAVIPLGDDVLLRNNDDFYRPSFAGELSCVPQLVVRICKLGKCVGERFAGRYYEEVGVGIRFFADDFGRDLQSRGLPVGMASSFVESAAISPLLPLVECGNADYSLMVNNETVYSGGLSQQPVGLGRLVAFASEFHTLKIGDFLYCGNRFRYPGLKTGDRLRMQLCGKTCMDFKIK